MFKIGDSVLYSRTFLRATGQLMQQEHKGRIISLEPISRGIDFALVEWPAGCGFPPKVLTTNLERV